MLKNNSQEVKIIFSQPIREYTDTLTSEMLWESFKIATNNYHKSKRKYVFIRYYKSHTPKGRIKSCRNQNKQHANVPKK